MHGNIEDGRFIVSNLRDRDISYYLGDTDWLVAVSDNQRRKK